MLLDQDVDHRRVFVGRCRLAVTFESIVVLALLVIVVVLMLRAPSVPVGAVAGGVAGMILGLLLDLLWPRRVLVITKPGVAVLSRNGSSVRPTRVVTMDATADLPGLLGEAGDQPVLLGSEHITLSRSERQRVLAVTGTADDRPPPPNGNVRVLGWSAGLAVGGFAGVAGILGLRYGLSLLMVGVLGLVIGGPAAWYGARTTRRSTEPVSQLASWSNLVTWLFPPLGVFTSAYVLGRLWNDEDRRTGQVVLATACILLSTLNAAIGAVQGSQEQEQRTVAARREETRRSARARAVPTTPLHPAGPTSSTASSTTIACMPPIPSPAPPGQPQAADSRIVLVGCGDFILGSETYRYSSARCSPSTRTGAPRRPPSPSPCSSPNSAWPAPTAGPG